MADDVREKLKGEVLDAPWAALAPHVARHAVLAVAPHVDLLDVAVAMAHDDAPRIQQWLETGELTRPSAEIAAAWDAAPPRFQAVIVQPWVLAQVLQVAPAPEA
jgi:hypothetical protein